MDRLEEVKNDVSLKGYTELQNVVWLISEIEQLREKTLHLEAIIEDRESTISTLQQALEE